MIAILCLLFIPFMNYSAASTAPSTQTLHRFMLANYHQYAHQLKQAQYWYDQLKEEEVGSNFYLGYVPYLESSGNLKELIPLIPKLDASFKNNVEIQSTIAHALEKAGKSEDAQNRLIMLNDLNKSNQELAFKVAQIYLARKEPENALSVINALLNSTARKPNNFIFCFLKAQILLLMNKKDEAREAIKMCVESYPRFDKGWLLYAVIEEQAGQLDHAISGFTSFLETTNEKNGEIEQHLLQLAVKQKLGSKEHPKAKHCVSKAMALFERKEYRKALAELDQCGAKKPEAVDVHLAKIQILITQKEYDKALETLLTLSLGTANNSVWLSTLHLMYIAGVPYEKLLHTIDRIMQKQPNNIQALLYKIDILLREEQSKKALPLLSHAADLVKDAPTKARILYQLGIIYYDTQKLPELKKVLMHAHEIDPTFTPATNLLAYYYAQHTQDFDTADRLIQKVLAREPENPHFLDTLALIRYKQKKYEQALVLLEQSAGQCPEDSTILEHLSKTLYKLGKHEQALRTLKTAHSAAKSSSEKSKLNAIILRWSTNNT